MLDMAEEAGLKSLKTQFQNLKARAQILKEKVNLKKPIQLSQFQLKIHFIILDGANWRLKNYENFQITIKTKIRFAF